MNADLMPGSETASTSLDRTSRRATICHLGSYGALQSQGDRPKYRIVTPAWAEYRTLGVCHAR